MLIHICVLFYELSIHQIISEDALFCFLHREPHLRRHPNLVTLDQKLLFCVQEKCQIEYTIQLAPWIFVEQDIKTLNYNNLVLLAIKMDLVLLWVFLCVVEVWEARDSLFLGIKNIMDESCGIEGKFGSSSCVSILRILHLVKLVPIVVVSVHCHHQSLYIMLSFQGFLEKLAEIAFSRCSGSGDANEWNTVFGIRNDSYNTINCLLGN